MTATCRRRCSRAAAPRQLWAASTCRGARGAPRDQPGLAPIAVSHDRGTNWTTSGDNLPTYSLPKLTVDHRHAHTAFATVADGSGLGPSDGPLYETRDAGASWRPAGTRRAGELRDAESRR